MAAFSLDEIAVNALDDDHFPRAPSMCQMFVRLCWERKYGLRFEAHHKSTADAAARSWQHTPYAVDPQRGSVPGDILYWFGTRRQPAGHTAIRIAGNKVAENSTVHDTKKRGARGTRPLSRLRKPDLIVRLPRD